MSSENAVSNPVLIDEDVAVNLTNVSKCFHIYQKPHHRLLQGLMRGKKAFYSEFWALKNASFSITRGQTVGIIGRNGAGKSTLLQILAGTLTPTTGSVSIYGRVTALLELGAGFNPEFTGSENILLNASIYGLSQNEIEQKYDSIVSFADIGDFIDQPVKTYSSGMHVRLAFAIQANLEPDVFIVDEALAVGDASFVHKCMLRFEQLRKRGTTIILVTHDATAVRTLCERAIWIDKGQICMDGEPESVIDSYLAALRNQPIANGSVQRIVNNNDDNENNSMYGKHTIERVIPNTDQRYGDQACSIIGAGLYDRNRERADIVSNDTEIMLRFSFINNCLPEGFPIIVGYGLRNQRGIDIASNNSEVENVYITTPEQGHYRTVSIVFTLPLLHPGSYAFNLSINYRDDSGNMKNADSLSNIIVFEIISSTRIHVLMSLKSDYIIENDV